MKKMKFSVIILILLILSGCSPVTVTQTNTYVLKTIANNGAIYYQSSSSINLLVNEPIAPEWLSSTNMAYQTHPLQLNYFSKNAWADTPAHLLQGAIVQCLQQSGRFHAVMSAPFLGNYDQRLDIRIYDFSQDFTQQPSQFHIKVLALLINAKTQRVMTSRIINVSAPALINSPAGGVKAANVAVAKLNDALINMIVS